MAQIREFDGGVAPRADGPGPFLIEGLPGVGLVGQIVVDHLVEELGMVGYAAVDCDGLPQVAVFEEDEYTVQPPVRLLSEGPLVALQSEVPVSPEGAEGFADCLVGWAEGEGVTPIMVSGLPSQYEDVPSVRAVSTGDGDRLVPDGVEPPNQGGVVSGPTGALLKEASDRDVDAVGLVVESDPQFPDPAAARVVIDEGIEPITGTEVNTSDLAERSEEIMERKERLAKRMGEAEEESTTATPTGMYH